MVVPAGGSSLCVRSCLFDRSRPTRARPPLCSRSARPSPPPRPPPTLPLPCASVVPAPVRRIVQIHAVHRKPPYDAARLAVVQPRGHGSNTRSPRLGAQNPSAAHVDEGTYA